MTQYLPNGDPVDRASLTTLRDSGHRQMAAAVPQSHRTCTSGPVFRVVTETEVESLTTQIFIHPALGEWFSQMEPLVSSGRREVYDIKAQRRLWPAGTPS